MTELLYAKYNSHRRPEFQLTTSIVLEDGVKKVIKRAAGKKAGGQLEVIRNNYKLLSDYYYDIKVIPYKDVPDNTALEFEFVNGKSILAGIDFEKDDISLLVAKLTAVMGKLLDVKDRYKCSFRVTPEFENVFGIADETGQVSDNIIQGDGEKNLCADESRYDWSVLENDAALTVANLDSIFSNFIDVNGTITCIDYEWVLDFPVPVDFLRYRMLVYLFDEKAAYISRRIERNDFIERFGISRDKIAVYQSMEEAFQEYVHGEGRKYIYLPRYQKNLRDVRDADAEINEKNRLIETKDIHISNLENMIKDLRAEAETARAEADKQKRFAEKHLSAAQEQSERAEQLEQQKLELEKAVIDRDSQIINLSSRQQKIKKSLMNPFYGFYMVLSYIPSKIKRKSEAKKQREMEIAAEEEARRKVLMEEKRKQDRYQQLLDETEGNYARWIEEQEAGYDHTEVFDYNPLISVVVPVYNVADEYLIDCIESVKAQYYTNWELILVDDASTMESVRKTLKKAVREHKLNKLRAFFGIAPKTLTGSADRISGNSYINSDNTGAGAAGDNQKSSGKASPKKVNGRIRAIYRKENGRISACTNTGLDAATGEYIAFMDCDDTIAPFALYEVVKLLNKDRSLDFIYSDEDKLGLQENDEERREKWIRETPFFKPDWSPDTLMSYMYTSHLGVYRASLVKEVGGLRSEFDGCQDYDMTLRFTEKTDKVGHISKILYHWRQIPGSTAADPEAKDYVKEATRKCKVEALKRRGLKGDVEWLPDIYQYRVRYFPEGAELRSSGSESENKSVNDHGNAETTASEDRTIVINGKNKVSVVIPSKDNPEILRQCISSFVEKTDYKNYEFIVVDNGSSDENRAKYEELLRFYGERAHISTKYIYDKQPFNFSHMCNTGAAEAAGEYILFLNDDIEIIESEWLDRMLGQAELPTTGAVGAKLLYPNTTLIQHAGVINIESGPVHIFAKMDDTPSYYFNKNKLDFDMLAVTAACLLVKKDKFDEIGGFDENLAVAYNDIDLCFKLAEAGYYNVIRNDAVLYHHESLSRGDDTMDSAKFARLMSEQEKLYEKHPLFSNDPYYNENLTQLDCDCSVYYDKDVQYSIEAVQLVTEEEDIGIVVEHPETEGTVLSSDTTALKYHIPEVTEEYDADIYERDESAFERYTIHGGINSCVVDWCIYIEGWALERGQDDNMEVYPSVILWEETTDPEATETDSSQINATETISSQIQASESISSQIHASEEGRNQKTPRVFRISTTKVHRRDVPQTFNMETNVEFAGFKLRLDRNAIPDGIYKIGILYKNTLVWTDKKLKH